MNTKLIKSYLTLTKYNYIVTIYLFFHYLFGNGEDVKITLDNNIEYNNIPKWSAIYLALGHFSHSSGKDLYDFNKGEWPEWLINIGTPFMVIW